MATSKAQELLIKWGWKPGKGLGKDENGRIVPVRIHQREENLGLGFETSEIAEEVDWADKYQQILNKSKQSINENKEDQKIIITKITSLEQEKIAFNDSESNEKQDIESSSDSNLFLACKQRRCRPCGKAKLRRIEEQDASFKNSIQMTQFIKEQQLEVTNFIPNYYHSNNSNIEQMITARRFKKIQRLQKRKKGSLITATFQT
eukprot:TRINITY_DN5993_c0_g4_i1.p1 TRINITY_DN5993_c0_g4~~TRINITY_DN5993_c0_g4_i1.p1  ORF type:complete len:223 (+),score=101.82 TRINITY_DN5993_c0_g4_i1:60-671(+)